MEPLHLKLGNGFSSNSLHFFLKISYIITFLITEKSCIVFNFLDGVAFVTGFYLGTVTIPLDDGSTT